MSEKKNKKYIYPKLSAHDMGILRLGGPGLGNLLFTYGWAVAESKKYNIPMIWPTWYSLKVGPYIRHEMDKRKYNDLFVNNSGYISGIRKAGILLFGKKTDRYTIEAPDVVEKGVVEYCGMDHYFSHIFDDYETIGEDIRRNLQPQNAKGLDFDFSDSLSVHIRCGDFKKSTEADLKKGVDSSRLPMHWYVDRINEIREIVGRDIKCYIFSDGTEEELSEILTLPNVERLFFGSAIADIMALSRAKLFIATGSTFSMWARFLGRMSVITYENQLLQSLKRDGDTFFECETSGLIPTEYHEMIRKIYSGDEL